MSLDMTLDVRGFGGFLDSELPEGTSVTMLARDGDETFEADPETERMLLDAIAQFERGDTMPFPQLLGQLRDRE